MITHLLSHYLLLGAKRDMPHGSSLMRHEQKFKRPCARESFQQLKESATLAMAQKQKNLNPQKQHKIKNKNKILKN